MFRSPAQLPQRIMLKARVVTALLLLTVLLCVVFLLPRPAAAVVFALIAALAAWEWAGLMRIESSGRILYAGVVLAFCWQIFTLGEPAYLLLWTGATFFWFVPAGLWLRFRWSMAGNDFFGYGLGLLLIVAAWAAMIALRDRGPWILMGVAALAWVADIAAYFAGRAWGRRKLAPNISPGKTWEGVMGALAGVLLYGASVALISGVIGKVSDVALVTGGLFLMLLTAISIVGDLFESLIKRQAGVKDSSGLLPGHGGVLDRIDSLLAVLPVAALLLHWSGK